jgi:cell division protein FtsQ
VPSFLIVFIGGVWFSSEANRAMLAAEIAELRATIQNRPEFMVRSLEVTGAGPAVTAAVRDLVALDFPVSSFDIDLAGIRGDVAELTAVKDVTVGVRAGGVLEIAITERKPIAVWRYADGLRLIDAEGVMTGMIAARSDRADLPLIAGDGAKEAIGEALALFVAAEPIAERVRGLVRMGERRWDVVLDRDQRILLPETGAVAALERVIALHAAEGLLDRDVTVVDMRDADRPTLRLGQAAVNALRNANTTSTGG